MVTLANVINVFVIISLTEQLYSTVSDVKTSQSKLATASLHKVTPFATTVALLAIETYG